MPIYLRMGYMYYFDLKDYTQAYKYMLKVTELNNFETTFRLLGMVQDNQVSKEKQPEALLWLIKAANSKFNQTDSLKTSQMGLYKYYLYDTNQSEKAVDLAKKSYHEDGNIKMGCNLASYYGTNFDNEIDYEKSYNPHSSHEILKPYFLGFSGVYLHYITS